MNDDDEDDSLLRAVAASPPIAPPRVAESGEQTATGVTYAPQSKRFEIIRRLGAGGMGVVYEARDRQRDVRVALKALRNLDGASLFQFKREYRALQGIQHPNLISLGDLVEEGGSWYFTMDLVRGVDFLRHVRGDTTSPKLQPTGAGSLDGLAVRDPVASTGVDETRLRESLAQLADGLLFLHEAGKLHRDLKPSNVLVDQNGRVVILDLGLVHDAFDDSQSADNQIVGTVAYMSPEQAAAKRVGPESDWYSVGVMIFQALTGHLPHAGTAIEVLQDKQQLEAPLPSSVAPAVPEDLDLLCHQLLRIDPSRRPTGEEIRQRLGPSSKFRPRPPIRAAEGAPFVGRASELRVLDEALRQIDHGRAQTVLILGDSGVGKSALVRRFVDTLGSETLVLAGRCYERESVPYRAVDSVIDALSRYLAKLPTENAAALLPRMMPFATQLFPVLLRVDAIARAPRPQLQGDPHEFRRRAFEGLRELFARIADRHRLAIIIDDLQWADADSLRLLDDLLDGPEAPMMLFVGLEAVSKPACLKV